MKNLFKAIADFQQECPVIHKGTKGHNYTYADLPTIFEVINPLLKKARFRIHSGTRRRSISNYYLSR